MPSSTELHVKDLLDRADSAEQAAIEEFQNHGSDVNAQGCLTRAAILRVGAAIAVAISESNRG